MAFVHFLPYILVLIFWCTVLVISLAIYFFNSNESDDWDKVYDNCKQSNAKYQYIIRFIFGESRKGFDIKKCRFTVDLMNSTDVLTQFTVTPKQFANFVVKPDAVNQKMVRFFLFRAQPFNVVKVVVNHNGSGTLFVNKIEIQDIKSNKANIAYIGQDINQLMKDKVSIKQTFPSGTQELRTIEIKKTEFLNCLEFFIFIFIAINIIELICVLLIPCSQKSSLFCDDYSGGMLSSGLSGLASSTIAIIVFTILITIYRYCIKKAFGEGIYRTVYIRIVILIGIISGSMAAFLATNRFPSENPTQDYNHEIFWAYGVGIGIIVFLTIWLPLLSIFAYYIGFFEITELPDKETELSGKTIKDSPALRESPTLRTDSKESIGDNYYQQLTAGVRVKSVSQYHGVK